MNEHYRKIKFLIDRSNYLYSKYKKESIYVNALLIKKVNFEIINYLMRKGHLFNCENEINLILDHFEAWYYQFNEKENSINSLSDEFFFKRLDQASPYPKEAIATMLKKIINL